MTLPSEKMYHVHSEAKKGSKMMKQISVNYLTINGQYTNGQSLCDKEEAMMSDAKIDYYLGGAKERGLNFKVESSTIEVDNEDAESYEELGYKVC